MGRSMWTPTGDEQLKRDLANRDRKIGELTRQVAKLTEQVADHAALVARVKELEAQLAAATRWEPLPDGTYTAPNWDKKGTISLKVSSGGANVSQWHSYYPDVTDDIVLPDDVRLCRVAGEGGNDE